MKGSSQEKESNSECWGVSWEGQVKKQAFPGDMSKEFGR